MELKNDIVLIIGVITIFISGCTNTNCTEIKEYYSDNSKKLIHVYPNCSNTQTYYRKHFYQNGQMSSYGKIVNNKKEGEFKTWYSNGNLSAIWNNKNGFSSGEMTCFREDGTIERKGNTNLETGTSYFKFYNERESIIAEGEYKTNLAGPILDSVKVGEWKEYYPNGNIEYIKNFRNKKLNGPLKSFYENGQLENEFYMVNDTINGVRKYYDSLGVKRMEGFQYNKQRVGKWKYWDENGNLKTYDLQH